MAVVTLQQPLEARYIRVVVMEYIVAPCLKLELMGCSRQDCVGNNILNIKILINTVQPRFYAPELHAFSQFVTKYIHILKFPVFIFSCLFFSLFKFYFCCPYENSILIFIVILKIHYDHYLIEKKNQ